jgi:hypothetical protein
MCKNARFDYRFLLGSDFISDSSSTVQFNQVKLHPYISYDTESDTIYKLVIPKMKAQDFISSLLMACLLIFKECKPRGLLIINWILSSIKTNPTNSFWQQFEKGKFKNNKIWRSESNQTEREFVYRAIIKKVLQRPVFRAIKSKLYSDTLSVLKKMCFNYRRPFFFSHHGFINEAFNLLSKT